MNKINYSHFRDVITSILNSYSEVFFVRGRISGILLLLLTFLNYNSALSGLIAVLAAYAMALVLGYRVEFLKSGMYTYNALLVGMAVGFIFELSWLSLPLLIIAGTSAMVITLATSHVFYHVLGLQILSIPFILISTLVFLSSGAFTNLFVNALYQPTLLNEINFLPFWLADYFKALGTILFMPNIISGCLIALLLLLASRILLLLSFTGFIFGCMIHGLFVGSFNQSTADLGSFNYILIAMSLGAIYNIPNPRSYLIAMVGVAMATILTSAIHVFWSLYGVPAFTLPFTVITLTFIYVLRIVNYPWRPLIFKETPEQTLDNYLTNVDRFTTQPVIHLPFPDTWKVWQVFNDKWTHQGEWQHAYDFVKTDLNDKTYANQGNLLEDYYCFGQPVVSPVNGRVVQIMNHLPDNPIGSVDVVNNWGNMVIIYDDKGFYVLVAHFVKDSIQVAVGDWLVSGTHLGLCGNSGYSPQPHIHINVQYYPAVGAPTCPFVFSNYTVQSEYNFHGLPTLAHQVQNEQHSVFHEQMTTFILDDVFKFEIYQHRELKDTISIKVKMEIDSTFYFSLEDSKLYFMRQQSGFYMLGIEGNNPYLKMLYLTLSSLPLVSKVGLAWEDKISNQALLTPIQQIVANFMNAIIPNWVKSTANYRFLDETTIQGKIDNSFFNQSSATYLKLDPVQKIAEFTVNDYFFKRVLL